MENEILIQGEAIDALLTGVLAAEYFLNKNYLFRRNVLNGKVEFSIRPAEGEEPAFRVLTIQAQNSIILPENGRATKLIIYSVTNNNASSRTTYWKEVAGKTYTESTATILSHSATRTNPNKVEFVLDNVPSPVTFTNAGEQQAIVLVIEYHVGGPAGPTPTSVEPVIKGVDGVKGSVSVQYFTLSGERVEMPTKGMYIQRTTTADGQVTSRKVKR